MSYPFISRALRQVPSIGALTVALVIAGACSSPSRGSGGNDDDDGDNNPPDPKEVAELGKDCIAACGSDDDRKCATASDDCLSHLCLVDPTQTTAHIAYCTLDCTSSSCPAGWVCEPIKSFGDPSVLKGCVAEPSVCGDGIVQLGEVCDGDGTQGICVDCKGWKCGDGIVQEGEVCDGHTAAGFCTSDCKSVVTSTISFSQFEVDGFLASDSANPAVQIQGSGMVITVPEPGAADGCGKLEILMDTPGATRFGWTLCDKVNNTSATVTFLLPKTSVTYTGYKEMPDELEGSIRLLDPAKGMDVTLGSEQASYQISPDGDASLTSDVGATKSTGELYFAFFAPDPGSGGYNGGYFALKYELMLPP